MNPFGPADTRSMTPAALLVFAAPFLVLAVSCGGGEAPEALPLVADITTTTTESVPATTIDLEPPTGEVTPAQQSMLDGCAEAIRVATADLDPEGPDFANEVIVAIMGDDSDVINACDAVMDPQSGIGQDVLITFMLEQLPPELLGALGEVSSSGELGVIPGSDGDPAVVPRVDPGAPD